MPTSRYIEGYIKDADFDSWWNRTSSNSDSLEDYANARAIWLGAKGSVCAHVGYSLARYMESILLLQQDQEPVDNVIVDLLEDLAVALHELPIGDMLEYSQQGVSYTSEEKERVYQ